MSYLDVPRLHFFGAFTANPSTLNNTPTNYNLQPPLAPMWNPNGSHAWKFPNVTVQTVVGPDGPGAGDPLVGTPVASTDQPSTAKLVDLDTEQQMVSMIFGLQVQVGNAASGTVTGTFQPSPFMDIFLREFGMGQDMVFAAYYQSVLTDLQWSPTLTSPILQQLKTASPDSLSIKFVVDDMHNHSQEPNFTYGRVAGTIGPAFPGEPAHWPVGRLMRPQVVFFNPGNPFNLSGAVQVNYTPFKVDGSRGKVIVDFGNTFPTTSPPASAPATPPLPFASPPPADLGPLQVAILNPGAIGFGGSPPVILGDVDNSAQAYQATAGIQEFDATPEEIQALQGPLPPPQQPSPLGVLQPVSGALLPVVLTEDPMCTFLTASPLVLRLNPGESAEVTLNTFQFGAPAPGQTVYLQLTNSNLQGGPGNLQVGVPADAIGFPASVTTDQNGQATFTVTASPDGPGNPRGYIDGQVYGVSFSWPLQSMPDPNVAFSIHVYDKVEVPANPTWENDVEPILLPYNDLYPFMAKIIPLANEQAVEQHRADIEMRMQLPLTDPRYMPVTRDISDAKKQIVLKWLASLPGSSSGSG
jgi:hypothetical protein